MALIELRGISKHYQTGDNETIALHSIDLAIDEGEFIAIIGPSGSGKSTLMHILGLLDTPTTGDYFIDGDDMSRRGDRQLSALRRNLIGFVFQSFNLLPRLNLLQNVMLPLAYAGVPTRKRRERAMKLLAEVGIADRANYGTNQVSGGQIQRAAIARALANDPKLILADEPTGNLDTKSSQSVIDLLKELNRRGNTIIVVTHNPEIAQQTDRIVELRDGHIVSDSSTKSRRKVRA